MIGSPIVVSGRRLGAWSWLWGLDVMEFIFYDFVEGKEGREENVVPVWHNVRGSSLWARVVKVLGGKILCASVQVECRA